MLKLLIVLTLAVACPAQSTESDTLFTLKSTGNVGIGSIVPDAPLSIHSTGEYRWYPTSNFTSTYVCGITADGRYFIVGENTGSREYVSRAMFLYFIRTNERLDTEIRKQALVYLKAKGLL